MVRLPGQHMCVRHPRHLACENFNIAIFSAIIHDRRTKFGTVVDVHNYDLYKDTFLVMKIVPFENCAIWEYKLLHWHFLCYYT